MTGRLQTRLRIVDALDECMEQEPMDRVRVVELCSRAQVSRSTFYEYFHDVDDVETWMWDYQMGKTLYQAGRRYSCFEAHLRKFTVLLEHKHFFMCAFKPTSYTSITQHGGRVMQDCYEEVLREKMGRELTRSEALQLEFFVTGAKHMTRHWIEDGMTDSPELMAHVFTGAMPAFALPHLEPDPSCAREDEEGDDPEAGGEGGDEGGREAPAPRGDASAGPAYDGGS
jgi:AcrR family transcriptional regulator